MEKNQQKSEQNEREFQLPISMFIATHGDETKIYSSWNDARQHNFSISVSEIGVDFGANFNKAEAN